MHELLAPVAQLALPNSDELSEKAKRQLAFVKTFEVKTHDDYMLAADELIAVKAKAKALEEKRKSITGPINSALKSINDLFGGPAQLLDEAERLLKKGMVDYQNEQARIAAEARRKAEAEAEAERRRLEAEAAERAKQAEEQAKAAAAAKAAGDEQAAALAQAAMQRAQAESHTAEISAQLVIAIPDVTVAAPKAKGVSTSKKLDFKVESLEKLLAYIVTGDGEAKLAHPELVGLVVQDDVRLRAYVKGIGLACNLPGIRVVEQSVMAVRSKA